MSSRKVSFLTGTRADYGKLKPLMEICSNSCLFDVEIVATGIHMLTEYGSTITHIEKDALAPIYSFYNQRFQDFPDAVIAKTITGLTDYLCERRPHLLVIHGDRIEPLGAAIAAGLSGITVAHVEGGELSGTIDDSFRHAITKLSHLHFCSNEKSKVVLNRLGEDPEKCFVIGSPECDVILRNNLPKWREVQARYGLTALKEKSFGLICMHPVATGEEDNYASMKNVLRAAKESRKPFILLPPNNDIGCSEIRRAIDDVGVPESWKVLPSFRFEYYLSIIKHCALLVGNSSSVVREGPIFGTACLLVGERQRGRLVAVNPMRVGVAELTSELISSLWGSSFETQLDFGEGMASERFLDAVTFSREKSFRL
jgi:UDP-N-acetylglucosamine 2-epimerase (hydrolysing)